MEFCSDFANIPSFHYSNERLHQLTDMPGID